MTIALIALLMGTATTPVTPPALAASDMETLRTSVDIADRMTLPLAVNGQGPFAFTIDTGADRSVVSDALALRLAMPSSGSATVFGIGGPQSMGMVTVDRLKVGRREHRDLRTPVLPANALGVSGMLGIDQLNDQSVLLDFGRNRISIGRSKDISLADEPGTIVVTGRSRFGQLILTDARIRGKRIYVIIDTGAQNSIGNLALRKMLGREGPLQDRGAQVIGATGVTLPIEAGTLPNIELGGMTIVNMPIGYADVATFPRFGLADKPAILLGMDVLRGFERVAVDFRNRKVRFFVGNGWMGEPKGTRSTQGTLVAVAN